MLSINEVSNLARCGRKTVADAIKNGKLPALKLGKRLVRIRRQDVELWLNPKAEGKFQELLAIVNQVPKASTIKVRQALHARAVEILSDPELNK